VAVNQKNIFRNHLGLFLAELFCIPAFAFEMYRALSGNELSWAYVVEWPALGIYAIYMWKKMLREERGQTKPQRTEAFKDEARLAEWNAYLASMHRSDQPVTPDNREV
jgi:heme oxygenase